MIQFLTSVQAKLICFVILLVAIAAALLSWHHSIIAKNNAAWQAKINQANAAATAQLEQINEKVAQHQTALNNAQEKIIEQNQETENAKANYEKLRAQYAASTVRMSVAAADFESRNTQQNSDSSSAAGACENRSVNLVPEAAAVILAVARQTRDDVRLKNECIDLYNAVREQFGNSE